MPEESDPDQLQPQQRAPISAKEQRLLATERNQVVKRNSATERITLCETVSNMVQRARSEHFTSGYDASRAPAPADRQHFTDNKQNRAHIVGNCTASVVFDISEISAPYYPKRAGKTSAI